MLNPIFWKKVQGQKHTGRWGIVEHQIASIIVLFNTNAKSHKHPGIKLLSSESKTQLVNQRKQNSYRRAYIYIYKYICNWACAIRRTLHNRACRSAAITGHVSWCTLMWSSLCYSIGTHKWTGGRFSNELQWICLRMFNPEATKRQSK